MNKYNIEVGDKLGTDVVTLVDKDGISFSKDRFPSVHLYTWEYIEDLVNKSREWKLAKTKKMNKKIIGYTLLKDSISAKAGEVYKIEEGVIRRYKGSKSYVITQEEANQPEWFSPIYEEVKPTEVYVDTLAGKVKVTSEKLMLSNSEFVYTEDFDKVAKVVNKVIAKTSMHNVLIETFKVGCKTFHASDVQKIEEAIKQVS